MILAEREGVTYRYAGDRALLVEYGPSELDLRLNFRVLAVDDLLKKVSASAPTTAPATRETPR